MDLGIRGEIALVLGGTQGLALSAAHHLSDAGAVVVLNGRDAEKGSKAVAELPNPGHFVQGDITIAADRAAIIEQTVALAGAPSILVTNSGGPPPGQFMDHDDETWEAALRNNMLGHIDMTRRVVPAMIAAGWGAHRQRHVLCRARTLSEPGAGECRARRAARGNGDAGA